MPELIRIRPRAEVVLIAKDRAVFIADPAGNVGEHPDHGFFVHETRLLSRWSYNIDGHRPSANAASIVRHDRWAGYYVSTPPGVPSPPADHGSGQVPDESRNTLELRVIRTIDPLGMRDAVRLTNYSSGTTSFTLGLDFAADFADAGEGSETQRRGECTTRVGEASHVVTIEYFDAHDGKKIRRSVEVSASGSTSPPSRVSEKRFEFEVTLKPRREWFATIAVQGGFDDIDAGAAQGQSSAEVEGESLGQAIDISFASAESNTLSDDVITTLQQAKEDLASLRLSDLDVPRGWSVAAGLPLYVALFGRDSLTAGWQAAMLGPEMMVGSLAALTRTQGTREDDWRDEQPGKMLHEAHTGPIASLGLTSAGRSYGSITTSGLFPFIVAELWHWTGDKDLVRPYIEPALRSLEWLDRYGDIDGDGFYEYRTRSPFGPVHQAWKDSPDAIVDEEGGDVVPPIATCEEQAFVYVAKLHLAETLWALGESNLAAGIYRSASELKKRFNDVFWMESEGYFALALDAQKRPVRTIASNAGHCLAASIADANLVQRTSDRMFADDLFSGWGIRTLSSKHSRYNPYSYHLGSVWPVEQGTFAMGFWRYGLHERVQQIARAQFEAASLFEYHRLPELFGGHRRSDEDPFPGIYPGANPLQAWSSSSVFTILQALLGLYPYAPLNLLVIDPHLPDWFPEITLQNLRVGKATVTIQFKLGSDGRTEYRVLDNPQQLHVVRQASPWSQSTDAATRLFDVLESFLPHR